MKQNQRAMLKLVVSMLIFGSIGLLVRFVPLPSSLIALVRAGIGAIFLCIVFLSKHSKISWTAIKGNLLYLLLSGTAIGFNWILLFESYKYTTVAISTLCYYMAPIIVTLLSPFVLKERITIKRAICIVVALCGMFLISGIFNENPIESSGITGIVLGLSAAVLYASVILMNKKLHDIGALDRTIFQLLISAIVLIPYNLLTTDFSSVVITPLTLVLLAVIGIIHTGLAYYLYFGSMEHLSGQSIALASYIDPVIAVILSITVLMEPFDLLAAVGAVTILAAAWISERPTQGGSQNGN